MKWHVIYNFNKVIYLGSLVSWISKRRGRLEDSTFSAHSLMKSNLMVGGFILLLSSQFSYPSTCNSNFYLKWEFPFESLWMVLILGKCKVIILTVFNCQSLKWFCYPGDANLLYKAAAWLVYYVDIHNCCAGLCIYVCVSLRQYQV